MSDQDKLVQILKEMGVTFTSTTDDDGYGDVFISASASDKEIAFIFKDGEYEYCQ